MHGLRSASFFDLSLDHATGSCRTGTLCKIFCKRWIKHQSRCHGNGTIKFSDTTIHTKRIKKKKETSTSAARNHAASLCPTASVSGAALIGCQLVACIWICVPYVYRILYIIHVVSNYLVIIHLHIFCEEC